MAVLSDSTWQQGRRRDVPHAPLGIQMNRTAQIIIPTPTLKREVYHTLSIPWNTVDTIPPLRVIRTMDTLHPPVPS